MKGIIRNYLYYYQLFMLIFLFIFFFGCDGTTPAIYGSININSNPAGAKVYLDGVDTGHITPIVLTNIAAGTHTVKLELFHHQNKEDASVSVTAGETTYINWALTYATIETLALQPGSEGKDAFVTDLWPSINYEYASYLYVGKHSFNYGAYLEFDLNSVSLPPDAVVIHGDLNLYQYGGLLDSLSIGVYQVTSEWQENTITWNNQPISLSEFEAIRIVHDTKGIWRTWYINDLVKGWLDGSIPNYGILLKATDNFANDNVAYFRSSDYMTDVTKCPKLVIGYYVP